MREMKDSRIEWIGEIPESWSLTKIGDLYTLRNEKVSDKDYMPLSVTMQGILPQLETAAKTNDGDNRKLVKKGDFAINSRSDRRGSCGISEYDGSVSLINTVLCPRGNMNPGYYNWLFHSTAFSDEFYRWGHGIVDDLWTTTWQDMKKITIPVPSLSEQKMVADFLGNKCSDIDALISDIESQIDILEQYKRSVITEAVTKGLNPDAEMKDSGLEWIGDIPKDWEINKIKYVADFYNGDRGKNYPSGEDLVDDGLYFLTSNNIHGTKLDCNPDISKFITEDRYTLLGGAKLKKGDIIYCLRGSVGNCAINHSIDAGTIASSLVDIRAKNSSSDFLNYYLQSSANSIQVVENMNGTCASNLSAEDVSNFIFVAPPLAEQCIIADYLDDKCSDIDAVIADKQVQLDTLTEYKKSLIYEYVTGKKEVPTS